MGLQKGKTNNINGRPKGVQNKTTTELKESINLLVSNNIDKLQNDIDSLEPKDRLFFIEKLLKYVVPTKADMTLSNQPVREEIQLTAEQIQQVIDKL